MITKRKNLLAGGAKQRRAQGRRPTGRAQKRRERLCPDPTRRFLLPRSTQPVLKSAERVVLRESRDVGEGFSMCWKALAVSAAGRCAV
eukprot:1765782-Rhodomonas_salina.3